MDNNDLEGIRSESTGQPRATHGFFFPLERKAVKLSVPFFKNKCLLLRHTY